MKLRFRTCSWPSCNTPPSWRASYIDEASRETFTWTCTRHLGDSCAALLADAPVATPLTVVGAWPMNAGAS